MLTENAKKLLKDRYMQEDENSWEDICKRVAGNIATVEKGVVGYRKYYEKFYGILRRIDFLPNSPALMNAGTDIQYLSACMVLPVDDSMESIFGAVKNAAIINKAGAGTGFAFSRLRPEGDKVGSTNGVATGPVSFMRVFDEATEVVKQGGRRKGVC